MKVSQTLAVVDLALPAAAPGSGPLGQCPLLQTDVP